MNEMQRKQDACLVEVQRLSSEQGKIQAQAVDLLGRIETSILTLSERQDYLTVWERETRNELENARKTVRVVTEEMKNTMGI